MQDIVPVALGLMEYRRCLSLQNALHARVAGGNERAYVLFVEHPSVLTLGRHADPVFLKFGASYFESLGIDVVPIDRGGEVTAHEPGQLVMYPILRLADFRLMPKSYVHLLEEAVIATLRSFGLEATRDLAHPGIWTGDRKICAVGVRVRDKATLHGIALNVCNSLDLFDKIVPCGIQGRGVTSMVRELGRPLTVADVQERLAREVLIKLAERSEGVKNENAKFDRLQWASEELIISS